MKIEIKTNEIINFLALIHDLTKNYEFLDCPFYFDKNAVSRKQIREVIRSENPLKMLTSTKLYEIYKSDSWKSYWSNKSQIIQNIVMEFNKRIRNLDFYYMKKYSKFFEKKIPDKVYIYVCAGSKNETGRGVAIKPNTILIYPRNLNNYSEADINKDIDIIIHEIFHLTQKEDSDKEFIEKITRIFAPKGIILNKNEFLKNENNNKIYEIIEKAIRDNQTYKEVKEDLKRLF